MGDENLPIPASETILPEHSGNKEMLLIALAKRLQDPDTVKYFIHADPSTVSRDEFILIDSLDGDVSMCIQSRTNSVSQDDDPRRFISLNWYEKGRNVFGSIHFEDQRDVSLQRPPFEGIEFADFEPWGVKIWKDSGGLGLTMDTYYSKEKHSPHTEVTEEKIRSMIELVNRGRLNPKRMQKGVNYIKRLWQKAGLSDKIELAGPRGSTPKIEA